MTTEERDDRRNNMEVERRIDQVDAKVDRVGDLLESRARELRGALDLLMRSQDEHWEWFEKHSEMERRNSKQAVELLTSTVVKLEQKSAAIETQGDLLAGDLRVLTTKLDEQRKHADLIHSEQARRIDDVQDTLSWVQRTAVAAVLTAALSMVGAIAVFLITHH